MTGSGTAAGTDFQARVAASYAVSGLRRRSQPGVALSAKDIVQRVWCERDSSVDDIVIDTVAGGRIFVQAKTNVTASTGETSALAESVGQFVAQFVDATTSGRLLDPDIDRLVLAAGSEGGRPVRVTLRRLLDRARDLGVCPADAEPNAAERDLLAKVNAHIDRAWRSATNTDASEVDRNAVLRLLVVEAADVMDGEAGERNAIIELGSVLATHDDAAGAWSSLCRRFHAAAAGRSGGTVGTFIRWIEADGIAFATATQHSPEFVSPAGFFRPLNAPGRLLRHDLVLVGRDSVVTAVEGALAGPETRVVILPGRGGIGKTRILRAVADTIEGGGTRVVFAREGASLSIAEVTTLPVEPLVVIVDDAHQSELQLSALFGEALQRAGRLKILCAPRPAGVQSLRTQAASGGLDATQVLVLPALASLAPDDVRNLAADALGQDSPLVDRLAVASEHTPLLTVVGARLFGQSSDADTAQTGTAFREAILLRFSQELLGRVSESVPADQARTLAELVAALGPLDISNPALIDTIGGMLNVRASQVRRWLGEFQAAGLLLARGDHRRLTPETLAEELLFKACVDSGGRSTGFADELWEAFGTLSTEELLTNLAAVEAHPGIDGKSPLDDIWLRLERSVAAADSWGRSALLQLMRRAAYVLPDRAIRLARHALDVSVEAQDEDDLGTDFLMERVVEVLQAAGQHPSSASEVLDWLWELARNDRRQTSAHPLHPLRVAQELGGYDGTPEHHDALLATANRALADPVVDTYERSPLELLRALLERTGLRTRSAGHGFQVFGVHVDPNRTIHWRRRVREILVAQATTGSPRQARYAAAMFDEALRLPHGVAGARLPEGYLEAWTTDQTELLDAITEIEAGSQDPLVRHALSEALAFHAAHDPLPEIADRARALLDRMAGPEEELIGAIATPWGILDRDAKQARDVRVAERLLAQHQDGTSLAEHVNTLLTSTVERGGQPDARMILAAVCRQSAPHAEAIWRWAIANPDAPLMHSADVALESLRRLGIDVEELFEIGWASEDKRCRRMTALYLSSLPFIDTPTAFERDAIEAAVIDDDPAVRRTTSTTVLRLQESDPTWAAALALRAPVGEGGNGLDMLFATIDEVGIDKLATEDLDVLCQRLASTPRLEHFATALLASLAWLDPERAIDVWRRRLLEGAVPSHRIVPEHPRALEFLGGSTDIERQELLARLCSGMDGLEYGAAHALGTLLWQMALPGLTDEVDPDRLASYFAEHVQTLDAVQHTIRDWIVDGTPTATVTACVLGMPWQALLASAEWVHALIEAVPAASREAVMDGLRGAASPLIDGRTLGSDSPRLVSIVRDGQAAAAALPIGSTAKTLFEDLVNDAQQTIEADRRSDDLELEGWA